MRRVHRGLQERGTEKVRTKGGSSILAGMVFAGLVLCFQASFCGAASPENGEFRVPPYLQNPAPDAMTVIWFSEKDQPGRLSYRSPSGRTVTVTVNPVRSDALAYPEWEVTSFFAGKAPSLPFRHTVRLTGLRPDAVYSYTVEQGSSRFAASFRTAPKSERAIRFMAYSDSETEPESTGQPAEWSDPANPSAKRSYLIDQTQGYANNLAVINSRQPDFVLIAGDLAQHGGEQRDWDEFWKHIASPDGTKSIAGHIPFLAAPGNHDYYEGSSLGQYDQPGSERAIGKYLTYFEYPSNGAEDPAQRNRYYRFDYGPVTVISLDAVNGAPDKTDHDTNFYLKGEREPGGGHAPDFNPGSAQYRWLERQLQEAQAKSRFTFVMFHHIPYSVGPHGWPAGEGKGYDNQSGRPTRILDPLFMKYGVDAVLCGHDEMLERSEISGTEIRPDGSSAPHIVEYYDVGVGGDGLRGPEKGLANPNQKFLVHTDAPEAWKDGVLVDGGKHYGHLEINVARASNGKWRAEITPVYVFPLVRKDGTYTGYERRQYKDVITLDGR